LKLRLSSEEWYPVLTPDENSSWEIEVPSELAERYLAALKAFDSVRMELYEHLRQVELGEALCARVDEVARKRAERGRRRPFRRGAPGPA